MKEISVKGQQRTDTGKKATKLLRKEGLIPCNLYGEAETALSFSTSMTIQITTP